MVTDDINAHGGLLGRPSSCNVEDRLPTTTSRTWAARLVTRPTSTCHRRHLQLDPTGDQAPGVAEAAKLYI